MKHFKIVFDSVSEIAAYIESNRATHDVSKNGYGSSYDRDEKFRGGSHDDLIDGLRNGDIKALAEFTAANVNVELSTIDNIMHSDVSGAYVDMGAFINGAPECMVQFSTEESNRFCDIVCNISYSADTTHKQMMAKYMYIVKLIDLLERSNTRCKLTIICYSKGAKKKGKKWTATDDRCDITVQLKQYSEALSLGHLLFVCCNPLFLRGAVNIIQHINLEQIGFVYAGCCTGNDTVHPACDIYVPSMYADTRKYLGTDADFKQWVSGMLPMLNS